MSEARAVREHIQEALTETLEDNDIAEDIIQGETKEERDAEELYEYSVIYLEHETLKTKHQKNKKRKRQAIPVLIP